MSERTLVGFAGASVELVCGDAGAAGLADFLFRRFAPAADTAPCLRLDLAEDGPSTYALWRDGSAVYAREPAGRAALLLLAEAIYHLAAASRDAVLLHAAAVAPGGRGTALPGASGAGKSTLAAWLDGRGVPYLSDELVALAPDGTRLAAFPRPICLQRDARSVLPDVVENARRDGRLLEAADALLIAPRSAIPPPSVPLERFVFPRRGTSALPVLRPLSRAEAGLRLMPLFTGPDGPADHRLAAVAELARRTPAFELAYGGFDGIAEVLFG